MSEQSGSGGDGSGAYGSGQGSEAAAAGRSAAPDEALTEGERMARKLVRDVAAYEVDPPPPSRVTDGSDESGETSPPA